MVLSWILRSVSPQIARSISSTDNAYKAWKKLKTRFSLGDLFRISDIEDAIISLKQCELSVTNYFTKLQILWDELEDYRPLQKCTCTVKCTCSALTDVEKFRTQDQVIRLLKGLNESYSTIKNQIMLMDPLHSLDKVFFLVVHQERHLVGYEAEPRLIAAVGRGSGFERGFGRGNGELVRYTGGRSANNGKVALTVGRMVTLLTLVTGSTNSHLISSSEIR